MQSLKMGIVVKITRMVKIKVVIGSAIFHSGLMYMMVAAHTTPAL